MKKITNISLFIFLISAIILGQAPNAWINEIHYDNDGTDAGEAIEVVISSDFTDLGNVTLTLYNGSSTSLSSYDTHTINTFTAGATVNGFTLYYYTYPANGIQNGSPDGLALDYNGTLIQFLSYEGTFTASDGPAAGVTSVDIGVVESGSTPVGNSLQLTGSANTYDGFTWAAEIVATFGAENTGQTILATGADTPPTISDITITPELPTSSDAVNVSATVTDNNSVSAVVLTWGTDGSTYPNTINMPLDAGDIYVTTSAIPAQAAGTTVYFLIAATDDNSQTTTSTQQSYTIPDAVTIADIQSGTVTEGALVQVNGIVTAGTGEVSDGSSSFYIQDGTGQYTGINIYTFYYTVARGDDITLVGTYAEYNGKSEIENIVDLVINSSGNALPTAEVLTLDQADWEPWEGVLIQVEDVAVSNEDAGFGEWDVTDGTNTFRIDNSTGGHYSYTPVLNDQFSSITGPLNYTHDVFKLVPRDDADIVIFDDPTLPVADAGPDQVVEFSALVTLDGSASSDSDGVIVGYIWEQLSGPTVTLSDYEEAVVTFTAPSVFTELEFQLTVYDNDANSALDNVLITVGTVTIYDVQYATDPGTGEDCYPSTFLDETVTVSGIVTAVHPGTYPNFFLQDPDSVTWAGVYVYDATVDPSVGDALTITVEVDEYFGLTELKNVAASSVNSTGNTLSPVDISTGDLGLFCAATAEQYEGMLVRVSNVVVDSTNSFDSWYVDDGTGTTKIDDYFFDGTWGIPTNGATIISITGVAHYAYGEFQIYPRNNTDITFSSSVDDPVLAEDFILLSNYPNPFNPVTTISYSVRTSGDIKLSIYDLLGQEVTNLVNAHRNGGHVYQVIWNGRNNDSQPLPSGIYFTRLVTGEQTLTKKITLLK